MATERKKQVRRKTVRVPLTKERQQEAEAALAERKEDNPDAFNLPESKRTIQDLSNYFVATHEGTKKILPKEKRRYAIYIRKSTDDEAKQVRSLDDQRAECLKMAENQAITVYKEDIFEESASAKKSGNRPIFEAMLHDFQAGKYQGLISWSPDRLSRNMKEAGEVIEMVDHEEIQDLQFVTHYFENTPNGKMMLGILFATSKQYSDKLSVDVKRGTDGNIRDGKYNGVIKKGYYVDAITGYFVPDGFNWELLREAVNMCLYKGKTRVEATKFLNDAHFSSRKDQDEELKVVKVTKQMFSDMLEDPFYMGLYRYGDNVADLTELYTFLPLMTPDEYIELNKGVSADFGATSGTTTANKRLEYGLLRNKVICDYCEVPMQFQHQEIKRGKNAGKWVISFYCRNTSCQRHKDAENKAAGIKLKKSIRAKYVMAAIEYQLRHATKKSKQAYQMHIDKLEAKLAQDRAIARRKLKEAKDELRENERQYAKYQAFQVDNPAEYKKHHPGKLEHHEGLIKAANHTIKQVEKELKDLDRALPSEAEFYELINSYLLRLLHTSDFMEQDAICEELVSNLRAGNDSIPVIKLNPPYDMLVDLAKVSTGRG